jgi:hypothetical protein
MYKHKLIFDDQKFEGGMALPANANADCDTPMRVNGVNGKLAVTVLAASPVSLAAGATMTMALKEAEAEDDTAAPYAPAQSLVMTAPTGGYSAPTGDTIMTMIVPVDFNNWCVPNIATTDPAASGTVDVILEYLAG